VTRLNHFIHARSESNKFVTLWVGVLDRNNHTLRYVDAGHGYAMLGTSPTTLQRLPLGEQLPVGVEADTQYTSQTVPLSQTGCALLISDGLVEQPGNTESSDLKAFDIKGVEEVIKTTAPDQDLVASLFDAVVRHAGRSALADDATAVLVRW